MPKLMTLGAAGAARSSFGSRARRLLRWFALLPIVVLVAAVARQRFLVPQWVHVHAVDRGDVVREVYGRATVESRHGAELGFDLAGRISDVLVDEGDRVSVGQTVARLAPQQEQADVRAASSAIFLAEAAAARLDAEERRARATLALADTNAARVRSLVESGSMPRQELDDAEQQLSVARADLDRVRAEQIEARRQVTVAGATTESRVATAARASLSSPFDGLVTRRLKDPGDPVVVGTTVLEVVPLDRLWARASIDESMLSILSEGMPAEVALYSDPPDLLRGIVDRIGSGVDRQTHEALVDVLLARPPSRIEIGQRADVRIAVERRTNVVRVPFAFVHRESDGPSVYVDRGGRIGRASVQLGLVGRELVEVRGGLQPGDVALDAIAPGVSLTVGRRWRGAS